MAGALPGFIYAKDKQKGIYVNLFIGSTARIGEGLGLVNISQHTGYPWNGRIELNIDPVTASNFALRLRIPGWAIGKENPCGLYSSQSAGQVKLTVNGKSIPALIGKGYAVITRKWRKGDKVTLDIPMLPRLVSPNSQVAELNNKLAIAAGPLVYAFEANDNAQLTGSTIANNATLQPQPQPGLLNGINVITVKSAGKEQPLVAIPFYAVGNRGKTSYQVWMDKAY